MPANYGEPRALFSNIKSILERTPSLQLNGLDGYRRVNYKYVRSITWTGTRSNGEFFFFESHLPPSEVRNPGPIHPMCAVRYYSEKEDLYIAYNYFQEHIDRWRDIDDAIWMRLREWETS